MSIFNKENKSYKATNIYSNVNSLHLTSLAMPLLELLDTLKRLAKPKDHKALYDYLVDAIADFESVARKNNYSSQLITQASYIICATLDEAILTSTWAQQANWSQLSLLSVLHEDSRGGENFFHILKDKQEDPKTNLELLELIYTCLSLGFKGKYQLKENGQEQIEVVRQRLFKLIQEYRHFEPQKLIFSHKPLRVQAKSKHVYWLRFAIVTGIVLFAIFNYYKINLQHEADTVLENIESQLQKR